MWNIILQKHSSAQYPSIVIFTIESAGAVMIHSVKALNGRRHRKNANTTVPSIRTTCFLYFRTLCDDMPLFFELAIKFGWSISVLAMRAYKIISIAKGRKKNSDMDSMKKRDGSRVSTMVKQTETRLPS